MTSTIRPQDVLSFDKVKIKTKSKWSIFSSI